MNRYKLIIFSAIAAVGLFALNGTSLKAQNIPALFVGSNPKTASLAGTSLSLEADYYSPEENASAMSLSGKRLAVGASYGMWSPKLADNSVISGGAFYRVSDKFAFGLSGKYISGKPMDITSSAGAVTGTFSPTDIMGSVALSYSFMEGLSAGVTGKFVSSAIAQDASGSSFMGDVSLTYASSFGLRAAVAVCNLGSPISYGNGSYSPDSAVKAGASYSIAGVTASLQADYLFSGAVMAGLGLEYSFRDIAFVRCGYHYGDNAKAVPSYASVGLGASFAGVSLNAACLLASEALGGTMLFGLSYSF